MTFGQITSPALTAAMDAVEAGPDIVEQRGAGLAALRYPIGDGQPARTGRSASAGPGRTKTLGKRNCARFWVEAINRARAETGCDAGGCAAARAGRDRWRA